MAERDLDGLASMWFSQSVAGWRSTRRRFLTTSSTSGSRSPSSRFRWSPGRPRLRLPARRRTSVRRRRCCRCSSVPPKEVVLLAPLTNPHEQVITIVDGRLRWGWHGDLDEVPAGYASELGVYRGDDVSTVLDEWGGAPMRPVVCGGPHRPTLSRRTSPIGPTTARPTGTAPRPARTIADSVAEAVSRCASRRRAGAGRRTRLVVLPS